jgi:hypothetical protein
MTKESFLSSVALHDRLKGNYRETLTDKHAQQRKIMLDATTERFIGLYEHLVKAGYNVFVHEMLSGENPRILPPHKRRRGYIPPKPISFGRFAHIWLPELNIAIRFCHTEYGIKNMHLGQFLNNSKPYCFLCVISPGDDPIEKFEKIHSDIKGYIAQGTANKKGVANTLVVPERKKRKRISTTEKA